MCPRADATQGEMQCWCQYLTLVIGFKRAMVAPRGHQGALSLPDWHGRMGGADDGPSAMTETPRVNGFVGWSFGFLSLCLLLAVWVVLAGWFSGDTQSWSQWLSWVPSLALLLCALIGFFLATFLHGRLGSVLRWLQFLLVIFFASWTLGTEWGMQRNGSVVPDDFVIVHWNAAWPGESEDLSTAYQEIRAADPNLVIITEPGKFGWGDEGREFMSSWPHTTRQGGVVLLSRTLMTEVRPLLASNGLELLLVRMSIDGRDRTLWVVDLPSDPSRSRASIFKQLNEVARTKGVAYPDIVVGDFNVPRHSHALAAAFPTMRNAFDEAGMGWSGTWPRRWPLWQLDQVLVGPGLNAIHYQVIDPRLGSHRMQRVVLRNRASPELEPSAPAN